MKKTLGSPFFSSDIVWGAIVTAYALNTSAGISGVILSAAALMPGVGVSPFLVKITRFLGRIMPHLPAMNLPDTQFSRNPQTVASMKADPLIYHKNGPARVAAQILITMENIQTNMQNISVPMLILHGTGDMITNPEGSRKLAERAASNDKTLKLYDGLYHNLLHEPEKDRVISDITDWLVARSAAAPQNVNQR